jgi:hydrogenase maturation protein HypF
MITHKQRKQIWVQGVVQGVGFRPFVYGLAQQLGLTGFVGNDSRGVFIEVEGAPESLSQFEQSLTAQPPPLAHIERVQVLTVQPCNDAGFVIVESRHAPTAATAATAATLVSPDVAICDACLRELFDPHDRRYRYPFINCTHCGPRFTITKDIPYDRPLTTMADFPMCEACRREYRDPGNRRFHAQPIACPDCGPELVLVVNGVPTAHRDAALREAQRIIESGGIVAVKGLGGFHLACDASCDRAVQTLRARKGRAAKPFALMALDLETIVQFAEVSDAERALLTSSAHPIVLLNKRGDAAVSPHIAPGNRTVGVMLPYTPLHYLLLTDLCTLLPVLVMTSGNLSDEPIVTDNDDAIGKLSDIADAILLHDRDIHVPCDDSVVRAFQGATLPIRRSRGYAPLPIPLPFDTTPTLAVGGELKATFCLAHGDHAFMSQHIGDMQTLETTVAFERALAHMQTLFRIEPQVIAADLHPGYLSTQWAERHASGRRVIKVQHHHAHIASVMAEHSLPPDARVIGVAFDGTGYGTDGAIWGGEVLIASYAGFTRAAHLRYVPLPGGDGAVKHPCRVALAHLHAAGTAWSDDLPPVTACDETERRVLRRQVEMGVRTVPTSSMGRLFDAVAALAGVRQHATYEGQAAIELESIVDPNVHTRYAFGLLDGEPMLIDPAPVIGAIVADVRAGAPASTIAARFHHAVADAIVEVCLRQQCSTGLNRVALSGGVFQNTTLLSETVCGLHAAGFEVLTHRLVPPNDAGLALGQAAIAQFAVEE